MATTVVKIPFADACPAQLREVLLPDELAEFERQYRQGLAVAAETFSLTELNETLVCWRRIAWMTDSDSEAHRVESRLARLCRCRRGPGRVSDAHARGDRVSPCGSPQGRLSGGGDRRRPGAA